MAQRRSKNQYGIRSFIILLLIVAAGGGLLWAQGSLTNPLAMTHMMFSMSQGSGEGFTIASPENGPEDNAGFTMAPPENTVESTNTEAAEGDITQEILEAALAGAGIDVMAFEAQLSAEGMALENILGMINSGQVSMDQIVGRFSGSTEGESNGRPVEGLSSSSLLSAIHWEDFSDVLYNAWVMLVATVFVIIISKPTGWIVKRIKQQHQTAT